MDGVIANMKQCCICGTAHRVDQSCPDQRSFTPPTEVHVSSRPSWEEYFIEIVKATAKRGSCNRGQSGAVIVKNNTILSAGYVGAPRGLDDCDRVGHQLVTRFEIRKEDLDERFEDENEENDRITIGFIPKEGIGYQHYSLSDHCIRTVHAEMNAILNAARHGLSCLDSEMYCTMVPCRTCAMAIIQSGIKSVTALYPYHKGDESIEMFNKVGIKFKCINDKELY